MSDLNLFNNLAHEYAERYRRGERLAITEYTDRYPDLAEEIRELFPWLVMMEQLGNGANRPGDMPSSPPCPDEPTPERLGDYRILREIGRGGMGIVYEAVQESLGRHVALKVLPHERQFSPIQLKRFQREARAAALLHHTNIVPVFGVGEHEGIHYFAMQYIHGQGLDALLRDVGRLRFDTGRTETALEDESDKLSARVASGLTTPLIPARRSPVEGRVIAPAGASPTSRVPRPTPKGSPADCSSSASSMMEPNGAQYFRTLARIGAQAAEALAHAHSQGVVHRDIKPSNLLLDLQGTLWITDFGLAKAEGSDELTSPGDVVGTLRYMAPERFSGESEARSDIYSLGLTLYEMVTLTPAFTALSRAELIFSILHTDPVRPRKHDPRIPLDLETIVLKAIARNPPDRFTTADEMAQELRTFIEGRPIRSRPVSTSERLWRWSRRNPVMALLTVLAACLATMLVVGSTAAAWLYRAQRDEVLEQRDAVRSEQSKTRSELGRSLFLGARAARYSSQPGRRSDALENLRKAAAIAHEVGAPEQHLADLRDEAIAAMALPDDRLTQTWPERDVAEASTAFSIAADRYVVLGKDGSIHVHQLSDCSLVRVMGSDRPSARSWPLLVPGGRFLIVYSGSQQAELWDLERAIVPAAWPADVRCAAIRADGAQVAALRSDGEIRIYDLPAVTEASCWRSGLVVPRWLRWPFMSLAEDGRRLALLCPSEPVVRVYEVASGRVVRELKLPPIWEYSIGLALGRNGRFLAIARADSITVHDVSDGEQIALLKGHEGEGILPMFQPGGDLLATGSWDYTTRLWDPIRGRLLLTLQGNFRGWAENGLGLAIGRDRELVLHQIDSAGQRRTIDSRMLDDRVPAGSGRPWRVSYSPDGQLIAMAMRPGVLIARASDGSGLAYLRIGHCDEAIFLPGGALLTYNDLGLCRWPLTYLSGGRLRLGPAEPLELIGHGDGFDGNRLAASASGRLLGATVRQRGGTVLVDPDQPWRQTWLAPNPYVSDLAISPDGRWAATANNGSSPNGQQLRIWETATGRLFAEFPAVGARVAFSPDGRWLGIGDTSGYRFLRVGSWEPGATIEQGGVAGRAVLAFHPAGRIVAILEESHGSKVRLVLVETGRVLASLEAGDQVRTSCLVFSPDGRFLAVARTDSRVDVWDLSSIRRRLELLDLASGLPDSFGAFTPSGNAQTVERILLEGADPAGIRLLEVRQTLRLAWFGVRALFNPELADVNELLRWAKRWGRLGYWRLAAKNYRAALARCPNLVYAANDLAWCLARMPGRGDGIEAVQWARKAVAIEPDSPGMRNTLGVALYRAGRFTLAAEELEQNTVRNARMAGYDWVFLALCRQRLGQPVAAWSALTQAIKWRAQPIRLTPEQDAEFAAFLQEAHSVLDRSLPNLPINVFDR